MTIPPDEQTAESYAERLYSASLGAYETLSVYVGLTLGWFASLAEDGPGTTTELARRTGTAERYCREFCELQAALGTLSVDVSAEPDHRVYTLPAGPAEVLLDPDSLNHLGPLTQMAVAAARQIDPLLQAYRDGGGVSWSDLGDDARTSQAALNRPWFATRLAPALAGVADLHAVLSRPGIRIADIGCGAGWSTLALARAYPTATVVGLDVDPPSIDAAERAASGADLTDRVEFAVASGEHLGRFGTFDAAFAFECLHDMARPVEVLSAIRHAVRPHGLVVVMDEAVADQFQAPGNEVERFMYGCSLFICLPDGLSSTPSVGTGTVFRRSILTSYAEQAGFGEVSVLPIDDFGFFRFYRLHN